MDTQILLSNPIDDTVFTFIDIETTGMSPAQGGRICEIAMLRSQMGETLETFETLVDPCTPIPPEVTMIHGITDAMVRGKPRFENVAPSIITMLDGAIPVCHNTSFDIPFIGSEMERSGLRFPEIPSLDTLKFARKHGRFRSNRLGAIADELGFSCAGWHRAMADVMMTSKIFDYFMVELKKKGARTLGHLIDLQTSTKLKERN